MRGSVLVSGASIAGCALAWWLDRYGFAVTLLERAPAFREGGQNVDVRGPAREVVRRMGLDAALAARGTGETGIAFVDADDRVRARFDVDRTGGDSFTAEREILRGDLADLLYEPVSGRVETWFGDHIAALDETGDGITVTLASGGRHRFDQVLVAEGIGSATRGLVFGAVERVPLDLFMGFFTIPKGPGDGPLARWFNAPGGRSVFLRPDRFGTTRAVLSLQKPPEGEERLDAQAQRTWLAEHFRDAGWQTPRVLAGFAETRDFYFEPVGQIRMPAWSRGRVALTGDAAWCASPISGMGTSLALVGAYVLAGELARQLDPARAFAAYAARMRPYVDKAQAVPKFGPRLAQPRTRLGIGLQRAAFGLAARPTVQRLAKRVSARWSGPAKAPIALPTYGSETVDADAAGP